jgi:hypothetical protein
MPPPPRLTACLMKSKCRLTRLYAGASPSPSYSLVEPLRSLNRNATWLTASRWPGASTSELNRSRNSCSVVTWAAVVASPVQASSSIAARIGPPV